MVRLINLRKLFSGIPTRRAARNGKALSPETLEVRSLLTATSLFAASGGLSHHGDVTSVDAPGVAPRIINGTVTTQFPTVGKVGDASDYGCSGTLIAPQYVLTAAHCAEGVSDTGGRFMLGNQEYRTSKVYVHPSYNSNEIGNDAANDIAIYKLELPVTNVTPSPIYRSNPAVGQMLTLVGFGYGGTGTSGSDNVYGIKRSGTTPIDSVSSKLISWNFDNNSESNTAPGDSGGAAFITVGTVNNLAGVTSGGSQDNAGIGDSSFDTRVDAFAAWIDSIVGSTPTTTAIVSVQASDASAAETALGQTANPGSFVISRTGPTTAALTVTWAMSGTATNGTDYNQISNTVTIPAGASSIAVPLNVKDDVLTEGLETAILTVSAGTGYSVDSVARSAKVSIADNEAVTSNNLFVNRQQIKGALVNVSGSNVGATREAGEPNIEGVSGGKSVWWTWTAPVAGRVTISTAGSSFDTTLGVYRGSSVSGLTRVASNDDVNFDASVFTSKVSFIAVVGQTYQIAVDGYDGDAGVIRLSLDQPAGRSVPGNSTTALRAGGIDRVADLSRMPSSDRLSLRGNSTNSIGRGLMAISRITETRRHRHDAPESPTRILATDAVFENGLLQLLDRL